MEADGLADDAGLDENAVELLNDDKDEGDRERDLPRVIPGVGVRCGEGDGGDESYNESYERNNTKDL